ncbi:hypothetical protein Tco_0665600 [Tanacetum coccineum]
MHFLLFSMSVVYVLTTSIPEDGDDATVEQLRKRAKWDNDDYVCMGLILNGMSDSLFDIYQSVESSKELWDLGGQIYGRGCIKIHISPLELRSNKLKNKGWVDGNGSNPSGGFGKLGGGRETRGGGDGLEGPGYPWFEHRDHWVIFVVEEVLDVLVLSK